MEEERFLKHVRYMVARLNQNPDADSMPFVPDSFLNGTLNLEEGYVRN